MKASVFNGHGNPLELQEVPDPVAAPGEVVIDIKATGLCHSDVSALDEADWAVNFPTLPIVLGHEPVGVISEVGEGVTDLKVGDRVGIPSGPPAAMGYWRDGAYAEKISSPADSTVKIPDGLDFVKAASGTDAGNVAYHAIVTQGKLAAGMKVGIIGIGGLGQIAARIGVLKGAEVYAAEIKEDVWPMAEALGVKRCVKDITELADEELDLIIDFAGFDTTPKAVETVRFGGRVVQVGMGKLVYEMNNNPLIVKEVELVGSVGGGVEDLKGVWALMADGGLDPAIEVTTFDQIDAGLDKLRKGEVTGRMVVDMQD